jgi:predicted nucleotidyltransferase component of viral defense system
MRLKAAMKTFAAENGTTAQTALQLLVMERLLARVASSRRAGNFVFKGGFLISELLGVRNRTTMDLDATATGFTLTRERLAKVSSEILRRDLGDGWRFRIVSIEEIRESAEYGGWRVSFAGISGTLEVPLRMDVTAGDAITPAPVERVFRMRFQSASFKLKTYNLESVLAEKLESILSRDVQNTRMRDFYDVARLTEPGREPPDRAVLSLALKRTSGQRGTLSKTARAAGILKAVVGDAAMSARWEDYRRAYPYARPLGFPDVCQSIQSLLAGLDL